MKLTKIYTRTGDSGTTSLVGGERTRKDSSRIEAYGTIDELSTHLGLLLAFIRNDSLLNSFSDNTTNICSIIERIQNNLFNVSTYLATDTSTTPIYPSAKIDATEIILIENEIDALNKELPTLNSFILPGGNIPAAQCHVCRTVCRRAERRIVRLINELTDTFTDLSVNFNPDILRYINRISDYLFVLSRKLNFLSNIKEKTWQNTCK